MALFSSRTMRFTLCNSCNSCTETVIRLSNQIERLKMIYFSMKEIDKITIYLIKCLVLSKSSSALLAVPRIFFSPFFALLRFMWWNVIVNWIINKRCFHFKYASSGENISSERCLGNLENQRYQLLLPYSLRAQKTNLLKFSIIKKI